MNIDILAGVHNASVDADGKGLELGDRVRCLFVTDDRDEWVNGNVTAIHRCRCSDGGHLHVDRAAKVLLDDGREVWLPSLRMHAEFPPESAFDDLEAPIFLVDDDTVDELDAVQLRIELRKAVDLIGRYRRDLAAAHESVVPTGGELETALNLFIDRAAERTAVAMVQRDAFREQRDNLMRLLAEVTSFDHPRSPRRFLAWLDERGGITAFRPSYNGWLSWLDEVERTTAAIGTCDPSLDGLGGSDG